MKKILALVLAFTLVLCASAVLADEEVKVLSHEEYINYVAPEGDEEVPPITVEAYVQGHQSWWDDKITVYAQDENEGGYLFYEMACSKEDAEKLVPGTKIRVTGYKSEWQGEVELYQPTFEFVDAEPYIAEAEDLTALLGTDELINHMNEFVTFKGLEVVASTIEGTEGEFAFLYGDGSGSRDDNGGVGSDLYYNVKYNDQVFTFCVESYLCGSDTDVYKAVEALQIGDKIDVEGFLYWYNGANPHTTSLKAAE